MSDKPKGQKGIIEQIQERGNIYSPTPENLTKSLERLEELVKKQQKAREKRKKEMAKEREVFVKTVLRREKELGEKAPEILWARLAIWDFTDQWMVGMEEYKSYRKWLEDE